MARLIDEGMIAQLSKKQGYFLKYFPARIRNVGEDAKEDRKLIYAFKDARDDAYKLVAQMVDGYLKREYGEQVKDMVFLCVPASRRGGEQEPLQGVLQGGEPIEWYQEWLFPSYLDGRPPGSS